MHEQPISRTRTSLVRVHTGACPCSHLFIIQPILAHTIRLTEIRLIVELYRCGESFDVFGEEETRGHEFGEELDMCVGVSSTVAYDGILSHHTYSIRGDMSRQV